MKLTPGQACFLYGWLSAKPSLTWNDVIHNDGINLQTLMQANIPLSELHALQPDLKEWIAHKKVQKSHILAVLPHWKCNVITDFGIDLGDLVEMKMSWETMLQCGITFSLLQDMGLTDENMKLFKHITMLGWTRLGMHRAAVQNMSEYHLLNAFGMKKQDVLAALPVKSGAV